VDQSLIGPPAGVSKWAVDPDYDAGLLSAEGGEEDSLEYLDAEDGGEGDSLDDLIIKAGSGP
jgi:hypothetical protein